MAGSVLAQLFILVEKNLVESGEDDDNLTGGAVKFSGIGRPLAASLVVLAITTGLTGIYRFYHLQNAMLRGKAISGGLEVWGLQVAVLIGVSVKHDAVHYRHLNLEN